MGKFTALADAVSDALAEFAAAEVDEPNDIDDMVQGLALIAQDFHWPYFRKAEWLQEAPGIAPWVSDALWEAGGTAYQVGLQTEELDGFQLVARR